MGGETAVGGKEVVVVMKRAEAAGAGFRVPPARHVEDLGHETANCRTPPMPAMPTWARRCSNRWSGGREVVCILEREQGNRGDSGFEYESLATSRTSTMDKELQRMAGEGYELVGLTVGQTAIGGAELVTILRRPDDEHGGRAGAGRAEARARVSRC